MSTIKPHKEKKISDNWLSILGDRDETPSSFEFHGTAGEKKKRYKISKGYETHYIYTDEMGCTAFVVERQKDEQTGKKSFFLHSKWLHKSNGQKKWICKHYPEPRFIFNLPKLKDSKLSKVYVTEGEKTCLALQEQVGTYPVTTYACGTYSILKSDWDPLLDFKTIVLVPDHDDKGRDAMHKLALHLVEEKEVLIENIHWVTIPKEFPEGWDVADLIPDTSDLTTLKLVHESKPYAEAVEDYKDIWNRFKEKDLKKEIDVTNEARLRELGNESAYIRHLNEILHIPSDQLVPLPHFDNNYAYLKVGQSRPSSVLLKDESFTRADMFCHNPKQPKGKIEVDNITYINRYEPSKLKAEEGDIEHWEEQGLLMFGEDFEVVEQYFAWVIQNQGEKAMWCMLWVSEQRGIGKGWFSYLLAQMLGPKNVRPNLKYKNVVGKFSDWIIGCQFAIINEIFISNTHSKKLEMSEEIKDLITEPTIHIEQKFRRSFDYINQCNFLLISNHENCMNINNEERRYWIKKIECQQMDDNWWKAKWKWAEEGGAKAVLHHLKTLTIKNPDLYKSRAPITDDFTEMAHASEHPIFKWLDEHREAESGPFKRANYFRNFNFMCVAVDLHRTLENFKQECALDVVKDWLKRRSFKWQNNERTKQIQLTNGTRPRAYIIPPTNKEGQVYWSNHLHSKTTTELGLLYEAKTERPNGVAPSLTVAEAEKSEEWEERLRVKREKAVSRATVCWNCHEEIATSTDGICPECDYAIKCSNCKKCACDHPHTKIKKKGQHRSDNY